MTPKQQLFVAEYMVDANAGPAAIRAGYSEASAAAIGGENLRKPAIAEAIAARMAEKVDRIAERARAAEDVAVAAGKVTVAWVLGLLYDTATRCAAPDNYQPAQVLRAAELAGKTLAMFQPEQERQSNVTFNLHFGAENGYFEQVANAGQVIEGEVNGDESDGETGGPDRQLRAGPSGGGQGEEMGGGQEESEGDPGPASGTEGPGS